MTDNPAPFLEPDGSEESPWYETRVIGVGEVELQVAFLGPHDGVPVVLLHGFPENRDQWSLVAPGLANHGMRVIAPDLRGYSSTARPERVEDYAIEHLVGDVVGLLDALDLTDAHLVAHDWGGTIGWFMAVQRPDRVRSFTVVSTAHPRAVLDALASDEEQREQMAYISFFRQVGTAEEALRENGWARLRAMCEDMPMHLFDRRMARLDEPGALTAALNYYRAYDAKAGASLGACRVPTTYVWGARDVAFGRTAATMTRDHVEGHYRFVELENTGHWISDVAPAVLIDAVCERVTG